MNPQAMGDFIIRVADTFGLDTPHVVAPDIDTTAVIYYAGIAAERWLSRFSWIALLRARTFLHRRRWTNFN